MREQKARVTQPDRSMQARICKPTSDDRILLFFVLLIAASSLEGYLQPIKYLKYSIGAFTIIVFALRGVRLVTKPSSVHWAFLALCVWGSISIFWGDTVNGAKDIAFIITYTTPFLLLTPSHRLVDSSFVVFTCAFLALLPIQEIGSFSLLESQGLFESGFSFIFGIYAIYYLNIKKYPKLLIAVILVVVTLKRISLLGIIVAAAIAFLPQKLKRIPNNSYVILAFHSIVVLLIFLLTTGSLDELIESITGKNSAWLTMGRTVHYFGVVSDIIKNPANVIFGNGAGSAYNMATISYEGDSVTPNLHSDTLKIFYEYGILFFISFFFLLGRKKSDVAQSFVIYLSVIFITDNTLIYTNVMFIYFMCFSAITKMPLTGFTGRKSKLDIYPTEQKRSDG